MAGPNTPTKAQLAALAVLQTTLNSALSTLSTNTAAHVTAQNAVLVAQQNLKNYEAYIYGGNKPGIYDEGSNSVT
jgi:hypothetical protein